MMKVISVKREGGGKEITEMIQDVTWSGEKSKAPRTLTANLLHTNRGLHQSVPLSNGDGLVFFWNDVELFRGIQFNSSLNNGKRAVTVYDQLIYTVRNNDTKVFIGKTADQIIKLLCAEFGIPVGEIKPTNYKIPYLVFDGDPLFDMMMKALYITYRQTGARFSLFSKEGKVFLLPKKENVKKWVIESGVNLVDYSYESSIDEMVTQVKLEAGEENKTIKVLLKDDNLIKKFGIMQHYEKISEKLNEGQLKQRAQTILSKEGVEKHSFKLDNILGIPDVITGTAIHVIVPDLGIKKAYYVDADSHTFAGRMHTMSLTLTETDEIPEIDAGRETDGSKKSASSDGNKEFAENLRKDILGDNDDKSNKTFAENLRKKLE